MIQTLQYVIELEVNIMVKVTNYGHSCFKIETRNLSVIIDPYQNDSVSGLKLPYGIYANYVLCSHDHFDHNGKDLIRISDCDESLKYSEIILSHDHHNGLRRGMTKSFEICIENKKIVHMGDIGCIPLEDEIKLFKDCDLLLIPINGHYTVSAKEAIEICKLINPKVVVPMHYYNAKSGSGYPDGNQIEIFKEIFKEYKVVHDYEIDLDDDFYKNKCYIFTMAKQ